MPRSVLRPLPLLGSWGFSCCPPPPPPPKANGTQSRGLDLAGLVHPPRAWLALRGQLDGAQPSCDPGSGARGQQGAPFPGGNSSWSSPILGEPYIPPHLGPHFGLWLGPQPGSREGAVVAGACGNYGAQRVWKPRIHHIPLVAATGLETSMCNPASLPPSLPGRSPGPLGQPVNPSTTRLCCGARGGDQEQRDPLRHLGAPRGSCLVAAERLQALEA